MSTTQPPTEITSFEAGVMCALASIRLYLQSRADWDEVEFNKYVSYFINSRQEGADKQAFDQALTAVGANHADVLEAIRKSAI